MVESSLAFGTVSARQELLSAYRSLAVVHAMILFANAEAVPEAIAEVFSRIDHKFDLMQHASKTTLRSWV